MALALSSLESAEASRVNLWNGAATINLPKAAELTPDGANAYSVRLSASEDVLLRIERKYLDSKARRTSSAKLVGAEVARLRAQGHTVESSKVEKQNAHIQFRGKLSQKNANDQFRVRVDGVRPRANVAYSAIVTAKTSAWQSANARALRGAARSLKAR